MHRPTVLTLLTLLLATLLPTTALKSKSSNAVLLSKIRTLTVRTDRLTSSRRIAPIPQLNCIGGNAQGLYSIDVLRCKNSGSEYDAEDVQWTCQASLPPEFKLGSTDVVCEGYESSEDQYVLKGSCGVEYRLVLTEEGEKRYGARESEGEGGEGNGLFMRGVFWVYFACEYFDHVVEEGHH